MSRAATFLVFLFLTFVFSNCSTNCDDCADDFSMRFTVVDSLNNEVFRDPTQVNIVSLKDSIQFAISREENEQDTVFLTSFSSLPDTVVFRSGNAVIDTAAVQYGFLRDGDCCTNPRIVERLNFFNIPSVRVIRSQYVYTRLIIN